MPSIPLSMTTVCLYALSKFVLSRGLFVSYEDLIKSKPKITVDETINVTYKCLIKWNLELKINYSIAMGHSNPTHTIHLGWDQCMRFFMLIQYLALEPA